MGIIGPSKFVLDGANFHVSVENSLKIHFFKNFGVVLILTVTITKEILLIINSQETFKHLSFFRNEWVLGKMRLYTAEEFSYKVVCGFSITIIS